MKVGECPACLRGQLRTAGSFKFRDFDGSIFNFQADFGLCDYCGFVRVLVPFNDTHIAEHYACHSLYGSLGGVGVGGSTPEDLVRYKYYAELLRMSTVNPAAVADIGCASGGLLRYLRAEAGYKGRLTGVDVDALVLQSLREDNINTMEGSALNLALAERSIDFAFYNHIFEHILNLDEVVMEMKRVLADGGCALIEVPDAQRYAEARVHDFYWLGMKEHVNHFTPASLSNLLIRHGLAVQGVYRRQLPMKGGSFYPSLIALAINKKKANTTRMSLKNDMPTWFAQHMDQEWKFAERTRNNIESFRRENSRPVVWGIGLEFFNLLALHSLEVNSNSILLDSNKAKQGRTVSNCNILDPTTATMSDRESMQLLCTSYVSWRQIAQQAGTLGFNRRAIFCI